MEVDRTKSMGCGRGRGVMTVGVKISLQCVPSSEVVFGVEGAVGMERLR